MTVVRLLGKLFAQWLAAGYLTFPTVLFLFQQNTPERLQHNDFLWVNACGAPLAALWVVLRHRRVRLGFVWILGRVVGLLVLSAAVTWVARDPARMGVRELDPLRIGAVLVLLWAWIITWRLVDQRWLGAPAPARGGVVWQGKPVRPRRGEVWSALVPFENGSYDEGGQDAKDRPCLVISTFARHVYVLKITSVDQGDRPGYVMMPSGWHPWSDKASWIKLQPLVKVPVLDFRQYIRDGPESVWADIADRYPPNVAPRQHTTKTRGRTASTGSRTRQRARP